MIIKALLYQPLRYNNLNTSERNMIPLGDDWTKVIVHMICIHTLIKFMIRSLSRQCMLVSLSLVTMTVLNRVTS